jgi:hypothetical protein
MPGDAPAGPGRKPLGPQQRCNQQFYSRTLAAAAVQAACSISGYWVRHVAMLQSQDIHSCSTQSTPVLVSRVAVSHCFCPACLHWATPQATCCNGAIWCKCMVCEHSTCNQPVVSSIVRDVWKKCGMCALTRVPAWSWPCCCVLLQA